MTRQHYIILFLTICIITNSQTIFTLAGNGTGGYSGDGGPAISATTYSPWGVCVDLNGNVYFADTENHCVRKVNTSGIISTFAGNNSSGYSGDGGLATLAQLSYPLAVTSDQAGNVFIAERGNGCIRKVNNSGIITTVAGNGTLGYSGDGGPATSAQLMFVTGVAVDLSGNIFVSDLLNKCVRKIDFNGIITTIAGDGTYGYSGDGGLATLAKIKAPSGVAVDPSGNIYVVDNNGPCIRKVNTSGIISTFAGSSTGGFSGDGGPASLAAMNGPWGIFADLSGNIYFADAGTQHIRKINSSGIINSIAGSGGSGFSGDGGPPTQAQTNYAEGVCVDLTGNLYIADTRNNRIRVVCQSSCITNLKNLEQKENISIYPNPSSGSFKFDINSKIKNGNLILMNSTGQKIYEHFIIEGINEINTNGLSAGLYNYILLDDKRQICNGKLSID